MASKINTSHANLTWFSRIPRNFFSFPLIIYSLYVGFGFLLSGLLHYKIWISSPQVETILKSIWQPSPEFALLFYCISAIIAILLYHLLFRKVRREAGILELIFWGTFLSLIFAWLPWIFASSIVSTVFLFLFGLISLAGFGLSFRLLAIDRKENTSNPPDSWKMLLNATKTCAAVLAILLGAIATSVLLPWRNTQVEGFELLRYALLCAYLVIGMLIFIIMPLLSRSLIHAPTEKVELEPPGPI